MVLYYNKDKEGITVALGDDVKLELLHSEIDRISKTDKRYLELEEEKQDYLSQIRENLNGEGRDLLDKLLDCIEVQNYIMLKRILRIGAL